MAFFRFTDLIKYLIGFLQKQKINLIIFYKLPAKQLHQNNDLPVEILLEIFYKLPAKQLHQNNDLPLENSFLAINDLPLEILLEIFYKLPAKQLHRNKIVCKLWSSLISNPSFPSQFSIRSISPTFTMFLTCHTQNFIHHTKHLMYDGKSWFEGKRDPFTFLPGGERRGYGKVECLGSSNGLVLCGRSNNDFYFYYVCNPTTKKWITLPSPPSCKSCVSSGFVCNPNSEAQFKVVRLLIDPTNSMDFTVEIFDSATNQWKVLKIQFNDPVILRETVSAIEHKGILYWECRKSNYVLVFDPNADQCHVFPLPGNSDHQLSVEVGHRLDVSQNDLYYIEMDFRQHGNLSTIWRCDELEGKPTWVVHRSFVLHDWTLERSVWAFKWTINHVNIRTSYSPQKVLGIDHVDCNILYLSFWNNYFGCKIYSMDIGRKRMENISTTDDIRESYDIRQSLMSVQPSWPAIVPNLPP